MSTKWLLFLVCVSLVGSSHAQVLVSGNSMDGSNAGFVSRINSLGYNYTFVAPANFEGTSLNGYRAVWLDGFSLYGNGLTTKLNNYLASGGTLLVQNPGFGSEPMSAYPFGSSLSAIYTYPPGENLIRLTSPGDPLNAGLSGASLSGWNASAFGIFTSIGTFTELSDNGRSEESITIKQQAGPGLVVYTQQGISQRLLDTDDPAALRLLNNVVATSVPEPGTGALLALGLVAVAMAARRRAG